MANIDRADWHYSAQNYPAELPPENGGTHIGMYLAWIVNRDLGSARLRKNAGDSLELLKERAITGRQLLFSQLDEKFFDGLLTKVGKDFTRDYYETDAYIEDYVGVFRGEVPSVYHVDDSWDNYDRIASVIDDRYARWQQGELPAPSPHRAALKQAEDRCYDAILEASRKLPSDPAGAIAVLEVYLSTAPLPPHRAMAERELGIIRSKYGVGQ